MVVPMLVFSAHSDYTQSGSEHNIELDPVQASPPLLLSPQESNPEHKSPKLDSSDQRQLEVDSPPSQPRRILSGVLYSEPQEGLVTPGTTLPDLSSPPSSPTVPLQTPVRSPRSTQGSIRRHPTKQSTTFGSFSRPENGPLRWPYARPALNQLARVADTLLSVAHISDHRDSEALERFFAHYAKEAQAYDQQMLAAWHKNLDIRLLFAGLFSAIITPFILETYKLLHQPSPPFYGPGGYAVRVNAMWFGSLVLNLMTALHATHCKQWLDGYLEDMAWPHSTSVERDKILNLCRLRQYRQNGLKRYHINGFISFLPLLLYLSVLLFALGLVDWLWHLHSGIAIFVTVLCGLLVIVGVGTTVLPMFTTRTPFKTPTSHLIGNLWRSLRTGQFKIKGLMEEEELDDVDARGEALDEDMFMWLMSHTRDEDTYKEAVRAQKEYYRQLSQHRRQEQECCPV